MSMSIKCKSLIISLSLSRTIYRDINIRMNKSIIYCVWLCAKLKSPKRIKEKKFSKFIKYSLTFKNSGPS